MRRIFSGLTMAHGGFKLVRQHDSMQCGVACLAMVCRFYGREIPVSSLTDLCGTTVEGGSLKGICDTAGSLGLETLPVRATRDRLTQETVPCILHWNQNHFVVLYGISKSGRYHVADPGKGKRTYTATEFESHWTTTSPDGKEGGIALFLRPTASFHDSRREPEGEPRSIRFIFRYLYKYKKHFALIVFGLLIGCLLQLVMPFLTQATVDIGIRHRDVGFIWLVLLGELMIVLGRIATDFVRRWLLLHISMRINISLGGTPALDSEERRPDHRA